MASRRRLIDTALCQRIAARLANAAMPEGWPAAPRVYHETQAPQQDPQEGDVVIGRGRLTSRAVEFGVGPAGVTRECTYVVPIETYTSHAYPEIEADAIDAIEAAIGEAIFSDPSLGGLVENAEVTTSDESAAGDDTTGLGEAAQLFVSCTWYATNPLA